MTPRSRVLGSLWILLLASVGPLPAAAVLIASGDGTDNTRSSRPDLPWAHVGRLGEFSAIHLGHRWVLTAAHVGAGDVEFEQGRHAPIPGSSVGLLNGDGSPSDLIVFRIETPPGTRPDGTPVDPASAGPSLLPLSKTRPAPGTAVVLVGHGQDRGAPLEWVDPAGRAWRGWATASSHRMRWGTNRVEPEPRELTFRGVRTRVLAMTFLPPGVPDATAHEAQAVVGDSGGAVFVRRRGRFVLAGVMIVRSEHSGQPEGTALFGNRTFAADVSAYRDQLIALTRPDCADERDNDDDGAVDFPDDPACAAPTNDSERPGALGLGSMRAPDAPRPAPR